MNLVEDAYNAHLDAMAPWERVQRSCDLFDSMYSIIEFQIKQERPDLCGRDLKIAVAEILYLTDQGAQRLLQMAKQNQLRLREDSQ